MNTAILLVCNVDKGGRNNLTCMKEYVNMIFRILLILRLKSSIWKQCKEDFFSLNTFTVQQPSTSVLLMSVEVIPRAIFHPLSQECLSCFLSHKATRLD